MVDVGIQRQNVGLTEGVVASQEKCADYLPPSEVTDCHRLFGDFQVTLKKREVKDKYVVSSIQLKVNNSIPDQNNPSLRSVVSLRKRRRGAVQ